MSAELPLEDDQDILGSEFCSGYTDALGKWNSGFYCPNGASSEALFCCGSATYKYCCIRREHGSPKDYLASFSLSLPLLLAVVYVVVAAIGLATLFLLLSACLCSCCSLHRKRLLPAPPPPPPTSRSDVGPLYRLQCSSTASGVANMYSFSTQHSVATTPVDGEVAHCTHLLVDIEASNGGMGPGDRNNGRATMTRCHTFSSDTLPLPIKTKSVGFAAGVRGEEDGAVVRSPESHLPGYECAPGPFVIPAHRQSHPSTPGTEGLRMATHQYLVGEPLVPAHTQGTRRVMSPVVARDLTFPESATHFRPTPTPTTPLGDVGHTRHVAAAAAAATAAPLATAATAASTVARPLQEDSLFHSTKF